MVITGSKPILPKQHDNIVFFVFLLFWLGLLILPILLLFVNGLNLSPSHNTVVIN